jgi:hypothetical protein
LNVQERTTANTGGAVKKLPPFSPTKAIGAVHSQHLQQSQQSRIMASSTSMPALHQQKKHGRTRSVMDEEKARMMREYGGGGGGGGGGAGADDASAAGDVSAGGADDDDDGNGIDSVPVYNNRRAMLNAAHAAAGATTPLNHVAPGHTRPQRTYKKTQPLSEFFAAMRATSLESATSFSLAGAAKAKLNTKQLSAADRLDYALRNS